MNYLQRFLISLKAQSVEISSKLLPLNKKRIVFNSSRNRHYNFNSKYLFEYFLENLKDYEVYFVINDKALNKKLTHEIGDYFINTNTIRGIVKASRAKVWVSSVINTPYHQLPVIKNKNRIVFHLGHGVPLKKIGLAEEGLSFVQVINRRLLTSAFTHILSYSEEFMPILQKSFKNSKAHYVSLGQPRNDSLSADKNLSFKIISNYFNNIDSKAKLVLYAPTWRAYKTTRFFPFNEQDADKLNDVLVKHNIFLMLREHPYFKFEIDSSFLKQSNILMFNADKFPEIMDYLPAFDKLITDYSSIYLDFLCMDKPVAFLHYDFDQYKSKVGFSLEYDEVTPGPKLHNQEELIDFIISEEDSYIEERSQIRSLINAKSAGNCKENADYIISLIK